MDAEPHGIKPNTMVRLRGDPSRSGWLQAIEERAGRAICLVQFNHGVQRIPCAQLEPCPAATEEPVDLLAQARLSAPHVLRRILAHVRISGRLADMIYSMEATNTDFYAYQFKPVLKMLGAPTQSLLIADEVGLGKTIEAALIWTELKARFAYHRLLVLCPHALREKWRSELTSRFNQDARIVAAEELLSLLENPARTTRGFAAIATIQGLRPPRGWNREDSEAYRRPSARLARFLASKAEQETLFDLLVIDEAHHLRNPETQSQDLGKLLQPLAHHRLFLSATPIHLRSRDLFSLLSLLDPDTFRDEHVLDQIIDANRPLIAARDALLGGCSRPDLVVALDVAASRYLLHNSEQLAALRRDAKTQSAPLGRAERAQLAERLEGTNLLANIINRTRRRDVKELRVIRQVSRCPADMTPLEREIYDRVRAEIENYAKERAGVAGFLFATPARLLASCIPAAVAHWRAQDPDPGMEDEENGTDGELQPEEERLLVERLSRLCRDLPGDADLERHDSKFETFLQAIREHLSRNPTDKLVVFSSFRPTLRYLNRRLRSSGIATALIHGKVGDRDAVLDRFRDDSRIPILLSSEVGSEGIDLQFCRVVVNYDLPWNPMRVEQRIGRIDRIGQEAEAIAVVNLIHRDTIDDRIYTRLYERLGLIESALGDFEEVLGEEIQKMTADLLAGSLTAAQQAARIEQTSQAIENNRRQTSDLEGQAGSLVAHGDAILRSIKGAHENHRFISARDLAAYLAEALATTFPGCTVHEREETDFYDIELTQDARWAYADWIAAHNYPAGDRLQREIGPVLCRLGRPEPDRRRRAIETITQAHPFVRFVSTRLVDSGVPNLRPAVAARISASDIRGQFPRGRYCVVASHWSFKGQTEQERIAYAGLRLPEDVAIGDEDAERLILAVAEKGVLWPEARDTADFAAAATSVCREYLLERLAERFLSEASARQAEQADRVQIQLRTLEQGYLRNRQQLEDIIRRQRLEGRPESIILANEGRLRALEDRVGRQRRDFERRRDITVSEEQFAVLLAEVI